jgi:membrane-associated protease RseP (regulator of RpoE activity)
MKATKLLLLMLALSANVQITTAQDRNENIKKTKKAFMGVTLGISWGDGVEISEVCEKYGAERAGLREGDIITAIDKENTTTKEAFNKILAQHRPGEEVEVSYLRGKEKMTSKVKLAESPYGFSISGNDWNWNWNGNINDLKVKMKKKEKAFLGIYPETDWDERAVRIDGFPDNSAARAAGFKKGDFILKIGENETNTEDELRYALSKCNPEEEVEILYKRNGKTDKKKVKLGIEKVIDWDNFNISVSDGNDDDDNRDAPQRDTDNSDNKESKPAHTWSTYTFADGTEVNINDFSASPNPVTNEAEVNFESKLNKPFNVVIYDAAGKEVSRKDQASLDGKFSQKFDLSVVPSGELFIKIWMDGKEVFSQKIIKK